MLSFSELAELLIVIVGVLVVTAANVKLCKVFQTKLLSNYKLKFFVDVER